jgi:outer membrane protein W
LIRSEDWARPLITTIAVVGSLAIAPSVTAQQGEWRIGGRLLSINTDAATEPIGEAGSEIIFDASWSLDFDATYMVGTDWGLEWMLTTAPYDLEASGGEVEGLDVGETWVAQSTFTLKYHIPLWGKWKPYVGGGLGLGYLHSSATSDAAEALGVHEIRSDLLAGAVGQIGVSYRAGQSWILNFDVKYNGASGDVELEDAAGDTLYSLATDLDSWLVGIGAAYRFK